MNPNPRILLIDDDPLVRRSLGAVLESSGKVVVPVADADSALAALEKDDFDAAISDVRLPGISGDRLLPQILAKRPGLPVIMMTAFGSIDAAVDAVRAGAADYLSKPIDDFELIHRLDRAISESMLRRENRTLRESLEKKRHDIVCGDPSMRPVMQMVESVAPTRATVLMRGESGTGKTMIARLLHARSERAAGPFIEVSCGALPDPLLESELFGHERGAFTGAERARTGKVEAADGGTLFLDEIANATPALQTKLLRVLQDRAFERLGGNEKKTVDVRWILATNADLEALVREGKFREDLYYRIHVVTIAIPPLRKRRSDIAPLVRRFVAAFAAEHKKTVTTVTPEFLGALTENDWPGNVRELENVVEHAVIMNRNGVLDVDALPPMFGLGTFTTPAEVGEVLPLREAMEEPERRYITRVLALNGGNRKRTAEMLDVNRTTLFLKMKKYGLLDESLRPQGAETDDNLPETRGRSTSAPADPKMGREDEKS